MKFYKKRIIQFTVFGFIGFCIYNFGLRFIEPVTQTEITTHAIATVTSLLLGVISFLGATYFLLNSLFYDEEQIGSKGETKESE